MDKVNKHSGTWHAVETFIKRERENAVEDLIAGQHSEQQRGAIAILDKLAKLSETPDSHQPVVFDSYT